MAERPGRFISVESPYCKSFHAKATPIHWLRFLPKRWFICDLSEPQTAIPEGWRRPPAQKAYQPSAGGPTQNLEITVAVDPVQGRLAFQQGVVAQ